MKIKMFGKKSVSAVLYWLFVLFFCILILTSFIQLYHYINNDYSTSIILALPYPIAIMNLIEIFSKTILFFLLIMIFKSFKSDVIFTRRTLIYLNMFTVYCLFIPILKALVYYLSANYEYVPRENVLMDILTIILPSVILGVFAAFIAAIFNRGFHLQTENDLTI